MKKRFSETQIIGFLREADAGVAVKELCRRQGFSDASYYLWRRKFGGLEVSDAKRLKALEQENARLKKLLAEAMLEQVSRVSQISPWHLRTDNPVRGCHTHFDRRSQYAAMNYQRMLTTHGIPPSMSRTGNCWDNASVESFFGTRNRELVYHRQYATLKEATQNIFQHIHPFYNWKRCHSTLAMTPLPSSKRGPL